MKICRIRIISIFVGGEEKKLGFTMGPNTSAYESCSATLNGQHFVFGGTEESSQKKQVFLKSYFKFPHIYLR